VDGRVNLAAVNRDFLRGFDPKSDFVTTDLDNRNDNVLVDYDALVFLARQDQHDTQLSSGVAGVCREDPSSHERLRTANPAGGSAFDEPSGLQNAQALSRGTGIVCPAARQNQASGNEESFTGQ
jgi:hypothetical protein